VGDWYQWPCHSLTVEIAGIFSNFHAPDRRSVGATCKCYITLPMRSVKAALYGWGEAESQLDRATALR
jgi:hypothetical protein